MLSAMTDTGPGYPDQGSKRTAARVVGVVCMGIALVLMALAVVDILSAFNSEELGAQPARIWMFVAALPFLLVGGIALNAGFLGASVRYAAGEVAPTARSTLDYIGSREGEISCPSCGARNKAGSAFCDDCGQPLTHVCPSCRHPNAADAKFCAACGTALS